MQKLLEKLSFLKYPSVTFLKNFIAIYTLTLVTSTLLVLILIRTMTSHPSFELKIFYEMMKKMYIFAVPVAILIAFAKSKGKK